MLRIGYGLLYLVFLLREFPHRDEIWGPDSPWTPALADQLFGETGWFSFLTLSDSTVYFELCYASALVVCALFLLGWRTRAVSVLFAVVVASFHARAIFMTDGGDNLILLMAVYLPSPPAAGAGPSTPAHGAACGGPPRRWAAGRPADRQVAVRLWRRRHWSPLSTTAACSSSPPRSASCTAPPACTRCRAALGRRAPPCTTS